MRINEKIHTFLGLNNLLNPASAEYREGMAWSCFGARINKKGEWSSGLARSGTVTATVKDVGGGQHQRQMTLNQATVLAKNINIATEGQNGYIYTIDSSVTKRYNGTTAAAVAALTAPSFSSAVQALGGTASSRIQSGLYYYILTRYDDDRKIESLPSIVIEEEFDADTNGKITLTFTAPSSDTYRIYRSKRTNVDEGVYNSPSVFYYLDDITGVGTTYDDYKADDELLVEYEGRGSVMTDPDFIVSYNDRMLYFKDNELWWSSSGRPEEVAQKYTLTFKGTGTEPTTDITVDNYPKLQAGYGEAKKNIPELAGQTITGAIEKDGKMWIFTASMVGYLKEAYSGEGYVFTVHRRGVGAINQHVLQSCEHGIFGFDAQGMWLLDNSNRIKRLTDNRVDLTNVSSGGADFTFNATNCFGVWCPNVNEYLMCDGTYEIAYQADRDIFVGPYSMSINSGCSWYSGTEAYGIADQDNKLVAGTASFSLEFYFGQSSPTTIKQTVSVEAVKVDNTKALTLEVAAGAAKDNMQTSNTITSHTGSAVRCTTDEEGRMIYAKLTVASGDGITTLNYRYDPIEWSPNNGR